MAQRQRPFDWRDKLGYLFGDLGNGAQFMLSMMFFMVFYTDVMGIDPAHVGVLLLVARLIDAFTDVGMGRLLDVLQPTGEGRFRPWIRRGAIPAVIASSLMYMPFAVDADYGVRVLYMCATYLLWGSITYTAVNIPYGAMAAVISDRSEHRSSLSVMRSLGGQGALLIISTLLPRIVNVNNQVDAGRMAWAAVGCSVFAGIWYFLCYGLVRERILVGSARRGGGHSLWRQLPGLLRNRGLVAMTVCAWLVLLAQGITQAVTTYLWKDYFRDLDLMTWAQAIIVVPLFAVAMVATRMATRIGKKELITAGLLFNGIVFVLMWIARIEDPRVFIILLGLSWGVAVYNTLVWAGLTDILDHQELISGQREDGTIYALFNWGRKVGMAASGFVAGWAVSFIGYDVAAARRGERQATDTVQGIYDLYLLVPGLIYVVAGLALWLAYPLGKRAVDDNFIRLRELRCATQAGKPPR